MARSVAELLPRRFAELTLDDVATIVASIGEERETLFFERKATVNGNSLAKTCSAFANTYGGLLLVGVADDDDELVGVEPISGEAQLWVKDTLRGLVLPMPPFQARWIPTEDDRGLLLVLVEESSTTPHLLTRSGAIYVRNPGSSDPVPISDQRRLLELAARGKGTAAAARERAMAALAIEPDAPEELTLHLAWVPSHALVVAAAGAGIGFEERLFARSAPARLSHAAWGALGGADAPVSEHRWSVWSQHHLAVRRSRETPRAPWQHGIEESVVVTRDGAAALRRGYVERERERGRGPHQETTLRADFLRDLAAAREILAELGGHGDLRLVYAPDLDQRGMRFDAAPGALWEAPAPPLLVRVDTTFDEEPERVELRVFGEIARAVGLGPREIEEKPPVAGPEAAGDERTFK